MTTTTTFKALQSPRPLDRRRRRWIAVATAAVALGGALGAVAAFDGSDSTDHPSPAIIANAVPAQAGPGAVSADAIERRATAADAARVALCSGSSADTAERCMASG